MATIEEYRDDLILLFEAAETASHDRFILSLFHVVNLPVLQQLIQQSNNQPIPQNFRLNVLPKCLHSFTNLSDYIDSLDANSDTPEFLTVYPKLYAYLQVIETKYIHKVLGNLCKVILGEVPEGELFDNSFSGARCFEQIQNWHQQIVNAGHRYNIISRIDALINKPLRNAIAHNDIYLHSGSRTIHIPTLQVKTLTNPEQADQFKIVYTFDEITEYYDNAKNYGEAFKRVLMRYVDLGERH